MAKDSIKNCLPLCNTPIRLIKIICTNKLHILHTYNNFERSISVSTKPMLLKVLRGFFSNIYINQIKDPCTKWKHLKRGERRVGKKIALNEKLDIPWGILASAWEETCYRVAEEKFSRRKLRRRGWIWWNLQPVTWRNFFELCELELLPPPSRRVTYQRRV